MRIKKTHKHDLGSVLVAPVFLRSGFLLPQPLPGMNLEVRVINVNPGFVHCDDIPQDPGVVGCQSDHEVADPDTPFHVGLVKDVRHKESTLLDKLQVELQYPVH